jgi:MFS family permease
VVNGLGIFKQTAFTKLWLAQILSQVAANLLNFALIILVYDLTLGSRFASFSVSLLVLSFAIPSIFAAPAAGTFVDYWDRKKILVVTNALRAGLVLLYIPAKNNLLAILGLTFVIATITQFFLPAEAATIPKVVEKKYLLAANSLFVFSMYAAFMVGFSASGPSVEVFGKEGSYYVTAAMFLLATIFTVLLPKQITKRPAGHLPKLHLLQQLKENWRVISGHSDRFFALIQMGITQGLVFILITLAPALSEALLHTPLQQASHVLIIPVGIGMVLGVLLVQTLTRKSSKRQIIEVSLLISGLGLLLLGLTGQLYRPYHGQAMASATNIGLIVGSIMLVLGAMNALISAAAQTLLQETTDDHERGKVFGSLQMLINVATTIPVFATGLLADLLSVTKVIDIIGAGVLLYAMIMLWRSRPLRIQVDTKTEAPRPRF